MKRIMFFSLLLAIFFLSCRKDDPHQPVQKETVLDYMPLSVGSYWIYDIYQCDSGEVNCEYEGTDTTFITRDTVIRGKTYYKLEGTGIFCDQQQYLRDSGNYIVDHLGHVVFTHTDSLRVFGEQVVPKPDTLFYWYYRLTAQNNPVMVPAGTFQCLDMRAFIWRAMDDFQVEYNCHTYYAKNAGLVKGTSLFIVGLKVVKKELTGYHIE